MYDSYDRYFIGSLIRMSEGRGDLFKMRVGDCELTYRRTSTRCVGVEYELIDRQPLKTMYDRTNSEKRRNAEGQAIKCETCLWWSSSIDIEEGECRVNPPDMQAQNDLYLWPRTLENSWCRCWTWNHYLKEIKDDGQETQADEQAKA